jgi:DNA-binding PadR family transcriptional regulator
MAAALGEFEQLILLAVVRLADNAYGVRIRQEIETRTGRAVSPGAIYTALDRLETRSLVRSRMGTATPERGGRRKKYYTVEPKGAAALQRAMRAMAQMAEGVEPRLAALRARTFPAPERGR